jgi:hypothetical protein
VDQPVLWRRLHKSGRGGFVVVAGGHVERCSPHLPPREIATGTSHAAIVFIPLFFRGCVLMDAKTFGAALTESVGGTIHYRKLYRKLRTDMI